MATIAWEFLTLFCQETRNRACSTSIQHNTHLGNMAYKAKVCIWVREQPTSTEQPEYQSGGKQNERLFRKSLIGEPVSIQWAEAAGKVQRTTGSLQQNPNSLEVLSQIAARREFIVNCKNDLVAHSCCRMKREVLATNWRGLRCNLHSGLGIQVQGFSGSND